jgi:hypothetical protein
MGSRWQSLRFWVKDTFATRGTSVHLPPDALSKTIKDSSHVRGGAGGVHPTGRNDYLDQVVEGQDAYLKSFKKKDEL